MSSFLSTAEKSEISSVFDDLHDTFKKDITIFMKSPKVLSGASHNAYYNRNADISKSQTSNELTPYIRSARIRFVKQEEVDTNFGAQVGLEANRGDVRLKVDEETANLIRQSVYVEIENSLYENPSDAQAIGPFTTTYYAIYLKRKI